MTALGTPKRPTANRAGNFNADLSWWPTARKTIVQELALTGQGECWLAELEKLEAVGCQGADASHPTPSLYLVGDPEHHLWLGRRYTAFIAQIAQDVSGVAWTIRFGHPPDRAITSKPRFFSSKHKFREKEIDRRTLSKLRRQIGTQQLPLPEIVADVLPALLGRQASGPTIQGRDGHFERVGEVDDLTPWFLGWLNYNAQMYDEPVVPVALNDLIDYGNYKPGRSEGPGKQYNGSDSLAVAEGLRRISKLRVKLQTGSLKDGTVQTFELTFAEGSGRLLAEQVPENELDDYIAGHADFNPADPRASRRQIICKESGDRRGKRRGTHYLNMTEDQVAWYNGGEGVYVDAALMAALPRIGALQAFLNGRLRGLADSNRLELRLTRKLFSQLGYGHLVTDADPYVAAGSALLKDLDLLLCLTPGLRMVLSIGPRSKLEVWTEAAAPKEFPGTITEMLKRLKGRRGAFVYDHEHSNQAYDVWRTRDGP